MRYCLALLLLGVPAAAGAQETEGGFVACSSQSEIQQVVESGGALVPDGCRPAQVVAFGEGAARVCAIELGEAGGIVESLRTIAAPDQLWVECDRLAASLR
jgi:hypothetical protein